MYKRKRSNSTTSMSSMSLGTRTRMSVKNTGTHKSIFIKQNSRKGSLKKLSLNLLKREAFPKTSIYVNSHYPLYVTVNDGVFQPNANLEAIDAHNTTPTLYTLGTLRIQQNNNSTLGRGNQTLVQFCDLSQAEFGQLHNKVNRENVMDNYLPVNLDNTDTNPDLASSLWFRDRELYLEKYESNYTLINTSNVEISLELITWQPKQSIYESLDYPVYTGTRNGNQSVLGCLNQDIETFPYGVTNTTNPINVQPGITDSTAASSDVRLIGHFPKLNSKYKYLTRKVVTLAPMEKLHYNISIPAQMLSNKNLPHDYVVNSLPLSSDRASGVAWRPFTRFLTIRAWSRATINSELVSAGLNAGASTFADHSLSITCSKYISVRKVPFIVRSTYINSTTTGINFNGQPLDSRQLQDTVVAADQRIYNQDLDEDPASNV